jgi:hypothetical protein
MIDTLTFERSISKLKNRFESEIEITSIGEMFSIFIVNTLIAKIAYAPLDILALKE